MAFNSEHVSIFRRVLPHTFLGGLDPWNHQRYTEVDTWSRNGGIYVQTPQGGIDVCYDICSYNMALLLV